MDDIQHALAVLRKFLAQYYGGAADFVAASKRASEYFLGDPDYKADVDDAFHIIFRNRLRQDAVANLVSKAANRPVENDEGARRILISLHDKLIPEPHSPLAAELVEGADALDLSAAIRKIEHGTSDERSDAVIEIGNNGNADAIRPLVELLKNSDEAVRWSAIQTLWRLDDSSATEPLIPMLKDSSDTIRRAAAYALGELRDEKAVEPLILALKDESKAVRIVACLALNHFGAAAVPRLIEFIEQHEELVSEVDKCINAMADPRAVDLFAAALENEKSHVREFAARVLSKFDDERAVRSLERALNDSDEGVRHHAEVSLSLLRYRQDEDSRQE